MSNCLSLSAVAGPLQAEHRGDDVRFCAVSSDTRTLSPGDLFIALQGPNFDGHRFIGAAKEGGAVAAMVMQEVDAGLPLLRVADTRQALGRLASIWREAFPRPLVAVTGSNGKTTVKEMIAAIFRQRGPVLVTQGNMNNDIGVPLTLLRLQDEQSMVVEMGANHPGEIGYLSRIARPDVALITNAGAAHLEGFGDLEGVARAKGEIVEGLGDDGVLVINGDSPHAPLWRRLAGDRRVVAFGFQAGADVHADPARMQTPWGGDGFRMNCRVTTPAGDLEIGLALVGRHNLMNALAAIAAAQAAGATLDEIGAGLRTVHPVKGRLCLRAGRQGYRVIDDSYNANPDSVSAAIAVLAQAPGERWLVLGDLAELGAGSRALHRALGEQARDAGIEHLYTVGEMSAEAAAGFGEGGAAFTDQAALIATLRHELPGDATVLVKGSRSAAMERVADALVEEGGC